MPSTTADTVRTALSRRGRWGIGEIVFWLVAAATLFFLPERHLILNEIAIIGLFALSLDLILGYAGIVSLGHAAFFGLGAYVAGLLAKHGMADPLVGLWSRRRSPRRSSASSPASSSCAASDLTKLMVTLGVALVLGEIANQASWLTGGADGLQGITMGPILGLFEFDIFGTTAYAYSLVGDLPAVRDRAPDRRVALRAFAARDPRQSSAGPRRRHPGQPPARRGLHACGRLCGRRRRRCWRRRPSSSRSTCSPSTAPPT